MLSNNFHDDPVPPQFADREQIIVVGFARSGNYWLSRLLADMLNSPFASTMQNDLEDAEGLDRPGKYVIRQRHWRVKHEPDAKYIYIYRDPRDVVTSMMYFWDYDSIKQTLHIAARGLDKDEVAHTANRWDFFMDMWLDRDRANIVTSYEKLYRDGFMELADIFSGLLIDIEDEEILLEAWSRQYFTTRKAKESTSPLLRKGIVGDWRNHFSYNDARIAAGYFNYWLLYLGYETATDWFEEIQ